MTPVTLVVSNVTGDGGGQREGCRCLVAKGMVGGSGVQDVPRG